MTVCPGLYHNNWRNSQSWNFYSVDLCVCIYCCFYRGKSLHSNSKHSCVCVCVLWVSILSLFQRFLDWILERFQQCGILYSSFYILTWSWILCVRINHDGMFYTITKIWCSGFRHRWLNLKIVLDLVWFAGIIVSFVKFDWSEIFYPCLSMICTFPFDLHTRYHLSSNYRDMDII
jgi:hypothetical protein